jgi:hypothetical protein
MSRLEYYVRHEAAHHLSQRREVAADDIKALLPIWGRKSECRWLPSARGRGNVRVHS